MATYEIGYFVGSLATGSINRILSRALIKLAPEELEFTIARAAAAFESWSRAPAAERAALLEKAADALEDRMTELVSLIVREGGRTYTDAVSEVREAADFCRYYALQGRNVFLPLGTEKHLRQHPGDHRKIKRLLRDRDPRVDAVGGEGVEHESAGEKKGRGAALVLQVVVPEALDRARRRVHLCGATAA